MPGLESSLCYNHNCSSFDKKLFTTDKSLQAGLTEKQTCIATLCGMPCPSKAREEHCAQLLHNPLLHPCPLPLCQGDTLPPTALCLPTGATQIPPPPHFCFYLYRTSLPLPPLLRLLPQHFDTSHFSQAHSVLQQGSR